MDHVQADIGFLLSSIVTELDVQADIGFLLSSIVTELDVQADIGFLLSSIVTELDAYQKAPLKTFLAPISRTTRLTPNSAHAIINAYNACATSMAYICPYVYRNSLNLYMLLLVSHSLSKYNMGRVCIHYF